MKETEYSKGWSEETKLPANVYCLFCQTKKAGEVAYILENRGLVRAFSPQIVKRQRVQGQNEDRVYDLLPGYVFVYANEELNTTRYFSEISGIIRRLGLRENRFQLQNGDRDFAMQLYRKNGLVGEITVFKEGDLVCIEDPLFQGCNGKITRMDYKKQRARVEFEFAGNVCVSWVACNMMEKKDGQI